MLNFDSHESEVTDDVSLSKIDGPNTATFDSAIS